MFVPLFIVALIGSLLHLFWTKTWQIGRVFHILLCYLLFVYVGLGSLLGAYGHIFLGEQIAQEIGWKQSPFQFEVGLANFSYGVLAVLACFLGRRFRIAATLGWSLFALGAFIGHIIQWKTTGDTAPYNTGIFLWLNDLILPLLLLTLLFFEKARKQ